MFGLDKQNDDEPEATTLVTPVQDDTTVQDNAELTLPGTAPATPPPVSDLPTVDTPTVSPVTGLADDTSAVETPAELPTEEVSTPTPEPEAESAAAITISNGALNYLSTLKQDALKDLSPIIDKIELPADEKLKTILMLYESTKDDSLLKGAYEAAKELDDEAERAEALLDLVHKIDEATSK